MLKISFPSMGWSKIAFKSLINMPGIEVVMPPKVTTHIAEMGLRYSPEFVCFPFKIVLGEMINLIENYDIHVFLMSVGCGPCRMGYYSPVLERILKDLGYKVELIPLQQADLRTLEWLNPYYILAEKIGKSISHLEIFNMSAIFFVKANFVEEILRLGGLIRCREIKKGDTTKTVNKLMKKLEEINNFIKLQPFQSTIHEEFRKIPIKRDIKPLRIMISGEIHVYLEPFVNMDVMKKFGEAGVEVHRAYHVYDWILHKLGVNSRRKKLEEIAKDYVFMDIGGEAIWDMGQYISSQSQGFDGYVLLYPFLCMPEVTLRSIIEGQSPDPFYLPIQYYSIDEHTAYEGMRTRMETFINLMESNRENNPRFKNKYVEPPEIAKIYDKKPSKLRDYFENVFTKAFSQYKDLFFVNTLRTINGSNNKDLKGVKKFLESILFQNKKPKIKPRKQYKPTIGAFD